MLAVEFQTNFLYGSMIAVVATQAIMASDITNGWNRLIFMFEKIECIADPESAVLNDSV
jgi:hypothetical protein